MNKRLSLIASCSVFFLTACTATPVVTFTPSLTPTPAFTPTATTLILQGPETPFDSSLTYPTTFTLEEAQLALANVTDAPPTISGDPGVQRIVDIHDEFTRGKGGFFFDHMQMEYSASAERWYIYPAGAESAVMGWLQIADSSVQSGWRWAEQPTWDSKFSPTSDTFQFGLPEKSYSQDHFEMGEKNGFPILIEISPDGTPVRWLTVLEQGMQNVTRAPETPSADRPVVMYADMSAEDGPQQCAENSTDLNSPNFDQQLQAWMESIRKQVGVPDSNVSLRTIPGTYPGALKDLYPLASFYFQSRSSDGKAPIVACGEAQLGDATGRIQFVDSFPFPTADGGTEPIMFGMIHEDNTLKVLYPASLYPYVEDNYVFRTLQKGRLQVRLEFYINSYYNDIPSIVEGYQLEVQQNINQTGVTIEPYLYTKLEAQRFSELFIQVFYKGNRSPEVLSELKELMQNQLLPGYIFIDTLE